MRPWEAAAPVPGPQGPSTRGREALLPGGCDHARLLMAFLLQRPPAMVVSTCPAGTGFAGTLTFTLLWTENYSTSSDPPPDR